jgi:hypothetical protein
MGYTLKLTPSEDDATLLSLSGVPAAVNSAPPLRGAPANMGFAGGVKVARPLSGNFFIRASELLPRVQRAFGPPTVQGVSQDVAQLVAGRRGALYLENCYQTTGDKKTSFWFFQRMTGDHWDLFDGYKMVAEGLPLAGNSHPGQLYFWEAR